MREYTQLFLRFAAAILRAGWQVEVFLFASELRRVTDSWRDTRWSEIEGVTPGCGGGTQWGASLAAFLRDYEHSGHW